MALNLRFADDVPLDRRYALTELFNLATKWLGITSYDRNVTVHYSLPKEHPQETNFKDPTVEKVNIACMAPRLVTADDALRIVSGHVRDFDIYMNPQRDFARLAWGLLHELFHLRQWITGQLCGKFIGKRMYLTWYGVLVDIEKVAYEDRPWEVEALGCTKDLAEFVITKKLGRHPDTMKMAA